MMPGVLAAAVIALLVGQPAQRSPAASDPLIDRYIAALDRLPPMPIRRRLPRTEVRERLTALNPTRADEVAALADRADACMIRGFETASPRALRERLRSLGSRFLAEQLAHLEGSESAEAFDLAARWAAGTLTRDVAIERYGLRRAEVMQVWIIGLYAIRNFGDADVVTRCHGEMHAEARSRGLRVR